MSALASAARVLNRIDDPHERNSKGVRAFNGNRKPQTPELRLLRDHLDLIGGQDEAEARRLDPALHKHGCRCSQCDRAPVACPVEECDATLLGQRGLVAHLRHHAEKAKKERAQWQHLTKSGAIALLRAVLNDPGRAATVDMRAIREFDSRLRAAGSNFGRGKLRRAASMRSLRAAILQFEADPKGAFSLKGRYPADVAKLFAQLALLCGVNLSTVIAACSLYGLEALGRALRADKMAPHPHIPGELREKPAACAFPSADE